MTERPEGADSCPNCGWTSDSQNEAHELEPGALLHGKYLVGRAIGQGGFGITYIAWDLPGEKRVAIKEFYPASVASRQLDRYTVSPFTGVSCAETFSKGRAKFYEEAKKLAQFAGVPGIVSAYDFFEENGTAYIVMEFLEGRTLKEELKSRPDPMGLDEALSILRPVAEAIEAVHAAGLIHRDISPDNIMLTPQGTKLLDFGAARAFSIQGEHSNTINVKMGYAPAEQYNVHGSQGAWTDVYALTATIYRCVTGRVPEQYYERIPVDTLTPPSRLNRSITPEQERVIMRGMALDHEDRFQTVRELMEALKNPLAAPWYAIKSDKFVGGDARTVSLDEDTIKNINASDRTVTVEPPTDTATTETQERTVTVQPFPPRPVPKWKPVLAIFLTVLGSLWGCLGLAATVSLGGSITPLFVTNLLYLLLQLAAIVFAYPTLHSAITLYKSSRVPERSWKPLLLSLLMCVLIPVTRWFLLMTAWVTRQLLFVGGFALMLVLSDFLVHGPYKKASKKP